MNSYQHRKEWKHEKKKKVLTFSPSSALTFKKNTPTQRLLWGLLKQSEFQHDKNWKITCLDIRTENEGVYCLQNHLTRQFFKDGVIIWLGEIFCDTENMDTRYKPNYSIYYCVKIQEEKIFN